MPGLRFPDFQDVGAWNEVKLKQIADRITTKNIEEKETRVLTNSAEYGVVDQRDFFNKDIASRENIDRYSIVEKGDYVYNPRISSTAAVGALSRNHVGTGVMSPLYIVFRFKKRLPLNRFSQLH